MPARGPYKFTQELAATICQRLADGESLRKIMSDKDMPGRTSVHEWLKNNPDFVAQYVLAREEQADAIFDECLDIADEKHESHEAIQDARLRIDTRKWMAAKLRPKKYGDRVDTEHTGNVTVNVTGDDAKLA